MIQRRPDRTLGPGHDDFWAGCAQGELRLQACQGCGKILWPVARACDQCGSSAFAWQVMSGRGKLVSWCSFVQDYYRGMLSVPYDTILVALDEGPLFISNPHGFGDEDCAPDRSVTLRFIDCEDAAGPFRLPVFALA